MPIIKSEDNNPLLQTKSVDLFQTRDELAEGVLRVDGEAYEVRVHLNKGCVDARVTIVDAIVGEARRHGAAVAFAEASLSDPSYRPVAVDPRDGEVVYHYDLTADMSPGALDRFFEEARGFIRRHGDEVRGFADVEEPASAEDDAPDFDFSELF